MLYLNNPKQPHYLYDDVVDLAIKTGIKPKAVYIYLAGLGIKGGLARIQSETGINYLQPVKLAVKDNKIVVKVSVCKHCNSLVVG